jgi:hypothetical protein
MGLAAGGLITQKIHAGAFGAVQRGLERLGAAEPRSELL